VNQIHLVHLSLQENKNITDPYRRISSAAKPALIHINIHTPTCEEEEHTTEA
jgi:hypothetical protein